MSIKVTKHKDWAPYSHHVETEFRIVVEEPWAPDDSQYIEVHPWDRTDVWPEDADDRRAVAVQIGYVNDDESEVAPIIIVNREDFVEGLLAVFPELKRA